jgi:serine O-acetyltransferase
MKKEQNVLSAAAVGTELLKRAAKRAYCKSADFVREVKYDINAFRQRDPAAKSDAEIMLLYSGFHARLAHRLSHKLYRNGHTFTARAVSQGAKMITGIEIHPGATIGKRFFIDHGAGIVIGETAEIGDNVMLFHGVTLGGTGKQKGKRHPTVEDNVMIGAGTIVLGPVTIGKNTKIGAGSVVTQDLPANVTAVGSPVMIVRKDGVRIPPIAPEKLTGHEKRRAI